MLKRKMVMLILSAIIFFIGMILYKSLYDGKLIDSKTIEEITYYREKISDKILNNNKIFLEKFKISIF